MLRLVALCVAQTEQPDMDLFSLVLVDDQQMAALNRDLRDTDGTTDVLAFEAEIGPDGLKEAEAYISVPQAAAQAADHRHSIEWELAFLVAHAVLHAAGYSDCDAQARQAMLDRQMQVLTQLKGRTGIARD